MKVGCSNLYLKLKQTGKGLSPSFAHSDIRESMDVSGNPSPPPPMSVFEMEDEWRVFIKYFLPSFQSQIRDAWKKRRTLSGTIQNSISTFCPPIAYRRLFEGIGVLKITHQTGMHHLYFATASDIPPKIVGARHSGVVRDDGSGWGPVMQAWWRYEYCDYNDQLPRLREAPPSPGNSPSFLDEEEDSLVLFPVRKIYVILSPVIFHYHPDHHRIGVSFRYSFGRKRGPPSDIRPWITDFGLDI